VTVQYFNWMIVVVWLQGTAYSIFSFVSYQVITGPMAAVAKLQLILQVSYKPA
jgi:hypothetical protein